MDTPAFGVFQSEASTHRPIYVDFAVRRSDAGVSDDAALLPKAGHLVIKGAALRQLQRVLPGWHLGFRRENAAAGIRPLYEGFVGCIQQYTVTLPCKSSDRVKDSGWTRLLTDQEFKDLSDAEQEVFDARANYDAHKCQYRLDKIRETRTAYLSQLERAYKRCLEAIKEEHCQAVGNRASCWKLFSRLRNASRDVPIAPSRLVLHFSEVYADSVEPLIPLMDTDDVFNGPKLLADYADGEVFSLGELERALKEINLKASVGPDGISANVLRRLFEDDACRYVLLDVMNTALRDGILPSSWAEADITVLYKGRGSV